MALHATPLDATIADKIRDKIIRGKYIDFSDLLKNQAEPSFMVTQIGEDGGSESHALMVHGEKKSDRLTYSAWHKAFLIYATVWVRAYPHDAIHILKYGDTIRELAANKARWYYYDNQFRRAREHSQWPWQSLQMEIWSKAMTLRDDEEYRRNPTPRYRTNNSAAQVPFRAPARNHSTPRVGQDQIPPGYCFAFHSGELCKSKGDCEFRHQCPKCHTGTHRAVNCRTGISATQSGQSGRNNYPNKRARGHNPNRGK